MPENTVVIERSFKTPTKQLWSIWTKPEYIKLWFGSDPNGTVISADIDLTVGGKYRISFKDSSGTRHTAFGEYLEIVEHSKLHYTWEWESERGHVSEVMVEFIPQGEKTLLHFTHAKLNPDSLHGYLEGWNSTFDKIALKVIGK